MVLCNNFIESKSAIHIRKLLSTESGDRFGVLVKRNLRRKYRRLVPERNLHTRTLIIHSWRRGGTKHVLSLVLELLGEIVTRCAHTCVCRLVISATIISRQGRVQGCRRMPRTPAPDALLSQEARVSRCVTASAILINLAIGFLSLAIYHGARN